MFEKERMMPVGNVCVRDVVTVSPGMTVEAAARRIAEHSVSTLVVVENNRPVGIVTDRDLVVRVLAKGVAPSTEVRAVMSPNPVCITEDESLEAAMSRMGAYQLRHLVVINAAHEVVGIFALDDLLVLFREVRNAVGAMATLMHDAHHRQR